MTKCDSTYIKRTQRNYSLGFKLQVVSTVEKGDMTYKQAQKIYGIQGRSTVLTWLRKHGKLDWSQPPKMTMPKSPHAKETPAQTIKRLERELQYCSAVYQRKLERSNITPSMTDGYDCYQNALAERVNGILKQEFLVYQCQNMSELKQLIDESILIYNNMRPHLSLDMKTPNQVHKKIQEQTPLDLD